MLKSVCLHASLRSARTDLDNCESATQPVNLENGLSIPVLASVSNMKHQDRDHSVHAFRLSKEYINSQFLVLLSPHTLV
jgi:hypothetical protein